MVTSGLSVSMGLDALPSWAELDHWLKMSSKSESSKVVALLRGGLVVVVAVVLVRR